MHQCNSTSRVKNLTSCLLETPSKVQSQVISTVMKQKVNENKENGSPDVSLTQLQGRPFPIHVGKPKDNSLKRQLLSANDLSNIQTNLNLSNHKTNALAPAFRVASGNRKVIESDVRTKLMNKSHFVDDLFDIKDFVFLKKNGEQVSNDSKVVVYCTNLQGFIKHIQNQREVSNPFLKLGIDG